MSKRAVIYARFSSHNQTEQSIEGQLRESYSKGYYAGGQSMLGYDIVEKHWVKNSEEAE